MVSLFLFLCAFPEQACQQEAMEDTFDLATWKMEAIHAPNALRFCEPKQKLLQSIGYLCFALQCTKTKASREPLL